MTVENRNMFKTKRLTLWLAGLMALLLGGVCPVLGAPWKTLPGHVPQAVGSLVSDGELGATNELSLAIGLPLRNEAELDDLLRQLADPGSPNFRKYITPQEFTARFGPTEQDYAAVRQFAETNGFKVLGTHGNRLVLDVQACSADVQRAFRVTLRTYTHPTEGRKFFAPDQEPSVPTNLPVADMWGLSDYGRARPLVHKLDPLRVRPLGGSVSGYYAGNDFRNAYVPGTTLDGSGQSVGLLQFSDYYQVDITNYQNTIGRTSYVPLKNVVLAGGTPTTANNAEVALDIEMAIAMAPALTQVIVYEIKTVSPSTILSRMANDNLAKQLSSSWAWSGGPSTTVDSAFKQMAAQGQSFFQASGDSDAYTGAQILDNTSQVNSPVGSTNITTVGGTTLAVNGTGGSWSYEQVWNYNTYGGTYANVGSGGGVSTYYKIPYWQTGLSTNASQGSAVRRNVPDVALTADQVYVAYNNGSSGGMAGTSCAAPLWAGFCALANQFAVATNGTTLGFLNPALYAIAGSSRYADCFHDITAGNNIGTNTAGLYNAVSGYDLCTGLGTPNGENLISALVWPPPLLISQPVSRNVTNGLSLTLSATASGRAPLSYSWLFNGTNLANGGNVSGATSNVLSIASATTNSSGSYQLVVSNANGVVTSSVALLNVGFVPTVVGPPVSQTNLIGGEVAFAATISGTAPLIYQWRKSGTNLANGTGITGATSNQLTLTEITASSAGSYSLYATNLFGVVTSSVASLTVVSPAAITGASLTNRTVECGQNTNVFAITSTGTTPLSIQWSLDGVPVAGATSTNFALTNLSLPSHTVTITVTNLYSSVTSNLAVTVQDTLAPVVTLAGSNPIYLELGGAFADPGATAGDTCAGAVSVAVSGSVNLGAVGTNTLNYSATDGNGNTNLVTRTVVVRDTTPPVIAWSFTNLVLAADPNCGATMPDVTGTNYILATDLSGVVTVSQQPTNGAILLLGTNVVVITAADASGNAAASTNVILVQEQTPPQLLAAPQSQTNLVGDTVVFSAAASACSPVAWQWFFNGTALDAQTNSALTLADLGLTAAGNYYVVASAAGGSSTSTVATLTVTYQPAAITGASLTNRTVECGQNTNVFAFTASGTTPLSIQWSLDGVPVAGATSTNFALTNLSLPSHTVTVTVSNLYSSVTSNLAVMVQDTLAPVVTLNGSNPIYIELGGTFADPGATASDTCSGTVPVVASGSVNLGTVGTNTLSYSATDGNGNTNTITRTVIVRDTTPPVIAWSFTNLVLAADPNCGATMPDITGTNYILAADMSGVVTVSQQPTNGAVLLLGTNVVVITAADASGNAAASTNVILVQEQTPPQLLAAPQSQTNFVGDTVVFSTAASACSPVAWQWFFNDTVLDAQTNSVLTLADLGQAAAGNYYVVASAAGGSSTSAVATLTVTLRPSVLSLSSSANPAGFKDVLSFAAAVTPASATGTLQLVTNGSVFAEVALLSDATASIPLAELPRGTNVVAVIYSGDGQYLAATNWLTQIITNHPPVALPLSLTNSGTFTVSLALANLAMSWSDIDGDLVSLVAVSVSTNGITVLNDGTTLIYTNGNNVADQFTCTLSDGWGGTNYQNITIIPALILTPLITGVAATGDGGITLNLGGAPGYSYILESTTNLFLPGGWLPVETNTLGTNGVWQFTDTQAPNFLQRFYRLELLP